LVRWHGYNHVRHVGARHTSFFSKDGVRNKVLSIDESLARIPGVGEEIRSSKKLIELFVPLTWEAWSTSWIRTLVIEMVLDLVLSCGTLLDADSKADSREVRLINDVGIVCSIL
jgi:hypothetical protein